MNTTIPPYPRYIISNIREALLDTPVILIAGPRQSGKTTLASTMLDSEYAYLTLDDETTLQAAKLDPTGFIRGLSAAVIDEIQRAPGLLLALKKTVDEDRRPGRFLITGSADIMSLPLAADSLAGRMEIVNLLPLSQAEIRECHTNWLDAIFTGNIPVPDTSVLGEDLVSCVVRGGYPESIKRESPRRRTIWIRQYLNALIQRDVNDIANIDKVGRLPQLLTALASFSSGMCNYSQLGGQVGLDHKTATKYLAIFEQMYLLNRVPAWATNKLHRAVKTPKLQFLDSGVLSTLLGLTTDKLKKDRNLFGNVLETFIYGEILKHSTYAQDDYKIYHYRDHNQYEVDMVIEDSSGGIIGVEVKAGATLSKNDFRGLHRLADISGKNFQMGIILYDGDKLLPFGDALYAAPISSLWAPV